MLLISIFQRQTQMILEKEQQRGKQDEEKRRYSQSHSGREEYASFRVNWVTQKTQRSTSKDSDIPTQQEKLIDKSHVRQLKLCIRKEINLIPSAQNNEVIGPNEHNNQNRIASSHELKQCSSSNSQKNSCEKRAKLSLISKRPSLRKISDFISYKEDTQNGANVVETTRQAKSNIVLKQVPTSNQIYNDNRPRKQGKKCIRISLKRQCLAQINKN